MSKNVYLTFAGYVILIVVFAFYWAANFSKFNHYKDDYATVCLESVIGITYIFLLVLKFQVRKIKLLIILLYPMVIAFASFFVWGLVLLITRIADFPARDILIYSFAYLALSVSGAIFLTRKTLSTAIR